MKKDNGERIQKAANKMIELAISLQAEGNRLYDLVEAEMRKDQVIPQKPEAKQ